MIPKVIHYCWFGGNKKSSLINHCISSWKKYLKDYELVEWNESNFDINSNKFAHMSYESNKFAFVADYVRALALYDVGGIYLDTDVEVKQNLDEFLVHNAFSGFEAPGLPFSAVWGSEKGHDWPKMVLNIYQSLEFDPLNPPINTPLVSELLAKEFGIDPEIDRFQLGSNGVAIYPSSTFTLNLPNNFTTHHFNGSWLSHGIENSYGYQINRNWRANELISFDLDSKGDFVLQFLIKKLGKRQFLFALSRVTKEFLRARIERFTDKFK